MSGYELESETGMKKRGLTELELKLVSELLRNSRRSDRALAKSIGVSQTTIGRLVKKLEREGFIKQYTAIPDFSRLGYELLALTFLKLKGPLVRDEIDEIRSIIAKGAEKTHHNVVMLNRGRGLGSDFLIASFHKDYASFTDYGDFLRQYDFFEGDRDSFLISLPSEGHHTPFTMLSLASKGRSELIDETAECNGKKESVDARLGSKPVLSYSSRAEKIEFRNKV